LDLSLKIIKEIQNNMASQTLQTIMVEAKSKFGVLDGTTNKWLNPKDAGMLKDFAVGHSYNVALEESTGKNGKAYLNIVSIVGDRGPSADVPAPEIVAPVFAKTPVAAPVAAKAPYKAPFKKAYGNSFKKNDAPATDWAAKDRSQLVGGLCHDAAALAAAVISTGTSIESALATYEQLLAGVIKLREGVK
jgi:hypothetical protein